MVWFLVLGQWKSDGLTKISFLSLDIEESGLTKLGFLS